MYLLFHALSQARNRGTLIRIIGIGSPFGDDAAGLEVARILTQAPPPNCEVIVADRPGARLLELLHDIDSVILIDAVRSGAKPGTLHQLSFDELDRCHALFVSSHELGVAASVQLARKLGRAPARGGVLGIEVSSAVVHVPCPLSRTMQQAVRHAVPQLLRWANELSASEDRAFRHHTCTCKFTGNDFTRRYEMGTLEIAATVQALMQTGKGILAMDESNPTCNKRFAKLGIPQTAEAHRAWRELILTTAGLGEFISGAILYDETIRQSKSDGTPFVKLLTDAGIVPGIKVDTGAKDLAGFPEEKVTEGLDGLRVRLSEYREMGARFAKWRAVITIGEGIPSGACLEANAHALARYAALCQQAGLVPIVEPEVLMEGNHTLEECARVSEATLHKVFDQLFRQRVVFEGMILKPNMVLSGRLCPTQASVEEVASATVTSLLRAVPAAVPGVAFLSGGQSAELASAHLNAMNLRWQAKAPWVLTFSFSRAIQQPALDTWKGQESNVLAAQKILYHRARCNSLARQGKYASDVDRT